MYVYIYINININAYLEAKCLYFPLDISTEGKATDERNNTGMLKAHNN